MHKLVLKQAISPIAASDGFFSPNFVVPRKDGGWRSVVNLKSLNQFIQNHHFKMESTASLRDIIQRGDFMGRLDLKDAYLTIPIVSNRRKYLWFHWKGQNYEFRTLPFGLASAPRVFTKLLRPVAAALRKKGIRLLIYLDNILVMAKEKASLKKDIAEVAEMLSRVGFVTNIRKSVFKPSTVINFRN